MDAVALMTLGRISSVGTGTGGGEPIGALIPDTDLISGFSDGDGDLSGTVNGNGDLAGNINGNGLAGSLEDDE